MTAFLAMLGQIESVLVWGTVATVVLTIIMYGSQGLGFSRLSLPFLLGTCLSPHRARAVVYGLLVYTFGGWVFAFLYAWLLTIVQIAEWWLGALLGTLHAVFLLTVVLPAMPYLHPRMATPYVSPTTRRRLEPPGFLGLNYGRRTPLMTVAAHIVYGGIIGFGYTLA
jgi:hypothetical protein